MSTYSKTTESWRCDDCGAAMLTPLFCPECGTDYPERRGFSAFAILGLPVHFDVDEAALERVELGLARKLHPDLWQGKGERLHKRALLAQSAVNQALDAVSDPFARAATLLGLLDAAGAIKSQVPKDFLLEQLELQEEIEDGVDEARAKDLKKQARRHLKDLAARLSGAFAASDLASARDAIDRSRYWRNVQRALRADAPS